MAKLTYQTITAYKRQSHFSSMTHASQIEIIKLSHGKKEVLYVVAKGYGQYECEGHYCEIMSQAEFDREYAIERTI